MSREYTKEEKEMTVEDLEKRMHLSLDRRTRRMMKKKKKNKVKKL